MRSLTPLPIALAVALLVGSHSLSAASSSSRVISPSVVSAWRAHDGNDGAQMLDLLLLLRGSPGWFAQSADGSSSGSSGGVAGSVAYESTWATYGRVTITIDYWMADAKATLGVDAPAGKIEKHEILLKAANVVLVDGIDAVGGPVITGSHFVEPRLVGEGDVSTQVIRRSPELYEFLRCETSDADSMLQMIVTIVCPQMRPR